MPSVGTIIGKIKCRVTGKVFPLYRYLELKSGMKLYQVTPEDCEERAEYIGYGTYKQKLPDMANIAKTIVVSRNLEKVTLPPNFDFVSLDTTDDYIPS